MKKHNVIATLLFSIIFVGSISVYYVNNNKIKSKTLENNSLKSQFQSLKSENKNLMELNYQLLETNAKVVEKVNKLKITIN